MYIYIYASIKNNENNYEQHHQAAIVFAWSAMKVSSMRSSKLGCHATVSSQTNMPCLAVYQVYQVYDGEMGQDVPRIHPKCSFCFMNLSRMKAQGKCWIHGRSAKYHYAWAAPSVGNLTLGFAQGAHHKGPRNADPGLGSWRRSSFPSG
jgi:hypothetical protein